MKKNSYLGDRMKRYEQAGKYFLPPRQPLVIRVDGRAFHTYTHGMTKPFDLDLIGSMTHAMVETAKDMQGFKLAYHQSDEVTFLLSDYDTLTTQGWFGYELNKVVSLSTSLFTAHFNDAMRPFRGRLATFDSRAFVIPLNDAPNVFIWRQQDWERNSVTMLAQAHYSHKELHGKNQRDMHGMLQEKGITWADYSDEEKYGTFLLSDGTHLSGRVDYAQIEKWIEHDELRATVPECPQYPSHGGAELADGQ